MARLVYNQLKYRLFDQQGSMIQESDALANKVEFTKPTTSKRPLPADLFASPTERTVSEEVLVYYPSVITYDSKSRYSRAEGPSSGADSTTYFGDDLFPPEVPFGDLDSKIRGKIKDQKVNVGQAIAEYHMTADMVTALASDVYKTFHSVRSGRAVKDFIDLLKRPKTRNGRAVADRWLQYQYGLRPLIQDIHGAAEELARKVTEGSYMFNTVTDSQTRTGTLSRPYGDITATVTLQRKVKVRYKISSSGAKTTGALGLTNPAAIAWEVIPWSFVIDWVLPIGDFLNGLDALVGVSDVKVQRGYKMTSLSSYAFHKTPYVVGAGQVTSIAGGHVGRRTVTRRVSGGGLSLGYPRFKNPLSVEHMANALALIRQLKN